MNAEEKRKVPATGASPMAQCHLLAKGADGKAVGSVECKQQL